MTMTLGTVLLVFAAQCLGYTLKAMIGFGNPLIAQPLISMRLDNVVITPGMLLMDLPINGYITWQKRKHLDLKRVLPITAAVLCGMVPGSLLLRYSVPGILKPLLGLVVVFLGVEMATRDLRPAGSGKELPWVKYVIAVLSGISAGLFGINMFIVAYLQRHSKDYDTFKGGICLMFFAENLCRAILYLASGIYTRNVLIFALISLPAAALAMVLGTIFGRRIKEETLKKTAIVMFILGGISIIVKSVFFGA